jgi:hypothetical protein
MTGSHVRTHVAFLMVCFIALSMVGARNGMAAARLAPAKALPAPAVAGFADVETRKCPQSPDNLGLTPDGDFHGGPSQSHYFPTFFAGQYLTNTEWEVTTESVDLIGAKFYHFAPYTLCSVDLDGTPGSGGIAHDPIATTSGSSYVIGFLLSGNGSCPPRVKKMELTAAGQSTIYEWDTAGHHNARRGAYDVESWQFLANGPTATIAFQSLDQPAGSTKCGPVVTNISVTAVGSGKTR